jgi:hypothetical protein
VEYLVAILADTINLFLCLIKHCAMKADMGVEVWLHAFLTVAVDSRRGQLHALAALPLEKGPLITIE